MSPSAMPRAAALAGLAVRTEVELAVPLGVRLVGAHPDRLLAVLGALQRVRHHHQRAPADERAGEVDELLRGQVADRRGPGAGLGHAVAAAHQVVLERGPAVAAAGDELAVVRTVADDLVHQGQHQRRVGVGPGRQPFELRLVGQVAPERTDADEAAAARRRFAHGAALDVAADAARGHALFGAG